MRTDLLLALAAALWLAACGPKGEFEKARLSEKLGRYSTALSQYESFWKLNSRDPKAPEAVFRTGQIFLSVIGDPEKARMHFRNVIEWYPQSPWAKEADLAIINSPDYFPFENGVRVMGDSQSGGANAKTVETLTADKDNPRRLKVKKEIFAGESKVSGMDLVYEKQDRKLTEKPSGEALISYPAEKGREWEAQKDGKRVLMNMESLSENLQVKAGAFASCLKILERDPAHLNFWRVQYYAPGKGLVLVSQGSKDRETRIMELLSWKKN